MLYGNQLLGTLKNVFRREVYYITSLSQRVHNRRFYCIAHTVIILDVNKLGYGQNWVY